MSTKINNTYEKKSNVISFGKNAVTAVTGNSTAPRQTNQAKTAAKDLSN